MVMLGSEQETTEMHSPLPVNRRMLQRQVEPEPLEAVMLEAL